MKSYFARIILIIFLGYFLSNSIRPRISFAANFDEVNVQAGWLLNGEFANVCSAIVQGYYTSENLKVNLIPGGPSGGSFIIATNMVALNSDVDIGIDGDIIPLLRGITKENKSEVLKIKAFAAFWNENPYGFIVKKDSGINNIKDFFGYNKNGKKIKVGVTADSVIQYAIANYIGRSVDDLELVTTGYDATPFIAGQVDVIAAYWTTQAYEVEKAGIEYKFISASEIPNFNQPSMIAIASDKTIKERPDMLARWLRATIKGSKFVLENPKLAAKHILDNRCGGLSFDPIQEEWLITKSLRLYDKNKIGWIYPSTINSFSKSYYLLNQIPRIPSLTEYTDYTILKKIYGNVENNSLKSQ